jgi:FtsP/CotA-like multicopper oxidase with cupredoxin domain
MRSNLGGRGGCSFTDGISTEAVAAVYYQNANTSSLPTTTSGLSTADLNNCGNDPLSETVALCPVAPDPHPPTTETIDITFGSNGTSFVWFMNNSSFRGDYNDPVLLDTKAGNLTFPAEYNVHNFGTNSSVRIIVKNNFQFGAHPLHVSLDQSTSCMLTMSQLHGHNFHVLAEGFGDWNGTIQNPSNTQRRDVQLVRAAKSATVPAYVVLQWTQDNPAVWPFHCHIAWHVSAGLYINIVEQPAGVEQLQFSSTAVDTCKSWDSWTNGNVPDQIDSGLK